MTAGFEFFEHTADIGMRVRGATLADLLEQAAAGLYAALGEFEVGPGPEKLELALEADAVEDLFHDWLSELLYRFETGHVVYRQVTFDRCERNRLAGQLVGSVVDLDRSRLHEEIKAITYHDLKVQRLADGSWEATVILDV